MYFVAHGRLLFNKRKLVIIFLLGTWLPRPVAVIWGVVYDLVELFRTGRTLDVYFQR